MSTSQFIAVFLLSIAFVPTQVSAHGPHKSVQDNQVNLTVVKYADHVQFNCEPANSDTATRSDWKDICNKKAASQASQLAKSAVIAPLDGDVFDPTVAGDTLSRRVPLSQKHL